MIRYRALFSLACAIAQVASITLAPTAARAQLDADASDAHIRAIVAQTLADAQTRSTLLPNARHAGWDDGFAIRSADGVFTLKLSGQMQFRANLVALPGAERYTDDFVAGFQTRRTKLFFAGSIFKEKITFQTSLSLSRTGAASLSTGKVSIPLRDGVAVTFGQFKLPFLFEETMSSRRQLAADRSEMNRVFTQGRSQGVAIAWRGDHASLQVAFSDGFNSVNTDLGDSPADGAITARLAWAAIGALGGARAFSSRPGSDGMFVAGVAGHIERSPDTPTASPNDLISATADALIKGDGWNTYGAFVMRHESDAGAGENATDFGFLAQGGFFLTERLEPFARYDLVLPSRSRSNNEAIQTVTVGANYYLQGHAAKLTVDAQWTLGDLADNDAVRGSTAIGVLAGVSAQNQIAVRMQFQLLF